MIHRGDCELQPRQFDNCRVDHGGWAWWSVGKERGDHLPLSRRAG
ncbi:hypothetical protein PXO_05568 [Xanthomonas oryzae pv. oryzae PXO99A]|uniref:Uncharacterized protein n=1 Tax=Xanthomonas oryzae pv. oryzae (strain PXO99A) TaxID=360094 RepID=A0A0K0GK26_XANOP|nr:hypothetical protein PXO_05568 [Xanthomonas oryzae pv. oryzae PXO99A]